MFVAFTDVFENLLIYHNDDMEFLDFEKYNHGPKKIFAFTNKDVFIKQISKKKFF